jgi:altronate dehydratase large subunit
MRGGQPTRGNIAGGLTTIEEKSLGALAKSGSSRFEDVIEYGEPIRVPGLSMMDSPGREPELLTGVSSSGASLVLFATGRGAPQGFPFVPVIKITGNPRTLERMREHMDCDVSGVMNGTQSLDEAARVLLEQLLRVIDGEQTKAEQCHYVGAMNIYTTGPTI